jgi:hypothetical protein
MQRPLAVVLVCFAFSLVGAGGAYAHDRETNNGVSVTVHIAPDDDPIATQPATIVVEKVETKATFTWATCKCAWKITDSSGAVVYSKPAKVKTPFVFPEPGAYQLTFSGRVKATKTRWRAFKINYAFRAEPPAA